MSKMNPDFNDVVVPAAGTHAMDKVCLGFQWDEPLDQALMGELSSLVSGKELGLPRKIEFSSTAVMKSEGDEISSPVPEGDSELMGIIFDDNTEKDSPVDVKNVELLIQRDGLLFTVQKTVTGWPATKQRAEDVIKIYFDKVKQHRKIISVGLQISNTFAIMKDDIDLRSVLKVESEYLPSKVFDGNGFWKLGSDYFFVEGDESFHLKLEASLSPEEVGKKLSILTLQRHLPLDEGVVSMQHAFAMFEKLYRKNVTLVRSLVHKNVCGLIGMEGAEG